MRNLVRSACLALALLSPTAALADGFLLAPSAPLGPGPFLVGDMGNGQLVDFAATGDCAAAIPAITCNTAKGGMISYPSGTHTLAPTDSPVLTGVVTVPTGSSSLAGLIGTTPGTGINLSNTIDMDVGGSHVLQISSTAISSAGGTGQFRLGNATSTNVIFAPNASDARAGLSADVAGDASLIFDNGGTAKEGLRVGGGNILSLLNLYGIAALTTWTDTNTCTTGQMTWDGSFIYVCTAANTVKRVALSTF